MREIWVFITFVIVLPTCFYFVWQEDLKDSADDLKAVRQYPMCATARIPRECGRLLDKAK